MENASKALIIAGGVLIGVAIISLALYLFASARGLVDASELVLEQNQIESFNRFYYSYAPNIGVAYNISGLNAYNVLRKIRNDNASDATYSEISLRLNGVTESELANSVNYFKNNYKITLSNDSRGVINVVTISK